MLLFFAVTVTFSIENAISWNVLAAPPSPKDSACDVVIAVVGLALPVNTAVGGVPPISNAVWLLPS